MRSKKMRSTPRLVLLAIGVAATGLAAATSPVASASWQSDSAQARSSCSLRVERLKLDSRRARKTVQIHMRCNYRVDVLGFRSSIPIRKVRRNPTLVGATAAEYMSCDRRRRAGLRPTRAKRTTLGGCSGKLGPNTRLTITVALRQAVCRPKRLRVRVETLGGSCGIGPALYPCAGVGYMSSVAKTVAGC